MTTISFRHTAALGAVDQAECGLDITGPAGTVSLSRVLVDTGAQYIVVPQILTLKLGISLVRSSRINVMTAGGRVSMRLVTGVSVAVNGSTGTADILFDPNPRGRALLGRTGISLIKEIGIGKNDWHWS